MNQIGKQRKSILEKLITSLDDSDPVRAIAAGRYWTTLASRSCGLAALLVRFNRSSKEFHSIIDGFQNKTAQQIAKLALSNNRIEASFGLAAINSLLSPRNMPCTVQNAVPLISELSIGKKVSVIGHFSFVDSLRPLCDLHVFEEYPQVGDMPVDEVSDYLPKSDVVVITSSAIINHTIDNLLRLPRPSAQVILLGPSTPFAPLLFEHGVTVIAGIDVVDELSLLQAVQNGSDIHDFVRPVCILA